MAAAELAATHDTNALMAGYAMTVLLVDDQAMIGELIKLTLRDEPNHYFYHCLDPHEAMEVAERVNPTVIVQDLLMPGVDGLTLVERYRANPATADVPVIVLSSTEKPAVKSEAFRVGASDYLIKPANPIELLARLRHHSRSYLNQIQRDEAYRALHEAQQQLIELNAELQRLTKADGLTGLSNRRYLDEYLDAEWKRGARDQNSLGVLMIDVDYFKRYNDTYGHVAGDDVLKKVADVIRASFSRPADLAGRFGGEEFMVILPNTNTAGATHVAEKIRAAVEGLCIPHDASSAADYVTVSIGATSLVPQRDVAPTTLIEAADAALYQAKKAGRNRIA